MIVLGAGRHTKDLITIIKDASSDSLFFFDDVTDNLTKLLNTYKVINDIKVLEELIENDNNFVIGVGNSKVRKLLYDKTKHLKPNYINLISDTAIIGTHNVSLGWGLNIMHQVFISNNVTIGNGTLINRLAGIHHDVIIGDFCDIGPNVNVLGGVRLGNNVMIGAGVTILPDIFITDNSVVGSGAVVTKNITKTGIYIGVPAKLKDNDK